MRRIALGTLGFIGAAFLLAAGLATGALYHRPIDRWMGRKDATVETTGTLPTVEKQFYTCSMHPQVIQDHPGKCPICHMDLEPVRGKLDGGPGITIDPVIVQNMGLRIAKVSTGPLRTTLRVVGSLVEPEQNHVEVNLRVSGWIQKLYANQDGMPVIKGDKLFDLYSADLTAAADELINARKASEAINGDAVLQKSSAAFVNAARRKLGLLGLSESDVDAIAKMDQAPATITFTSPITGHVVDRTVVEGSAVKAGDRVMRIADRSTMWLQVQVYEHQLPLVHIGTPVRAKINGVPDKTFEGRIEFIYPHLDMMSRTATMRVVLPNVGHELHEGMYASVDIDAQVADNAIQVPREAVLDSGTRQLVFIAQDAGHFEPRQVTVGQTGHGDSSAQGDDMLQILTGLAGNETVVTSGQFLLDSESRMREAIQKHLRDHLAATSPAPATGPATAPQEKRP